LSVLGIDLAAAPKRTFACALDENGDAELFAGCDDDRLLALAHGRAKLAIDAPFGWPGAFVDALAAHRRFEAWPAPDDGPPEAFRAALSFRATDRVVMHTRRPLSVSTDRLGVTAMRCAHLLHRWARAGEAVDRSGAGRFVEVYPAGALVRWQLGGSGYKGSDTTALYALLTALTEALPSLRLSAADRRLCESVHDAFDALVAALVARAALLGLTDLPPPAACEQAEEEGWIHLPLRGSLPFLDPTRAPQHAPEPRDAEFDEADREAVAAHAHPTWRAEFERLVEDPRRYRVLDAAALVGRYLELRCSNQPATLTYRYAEATDAAARAIHAAELAEFSRCVNDPRVRFVAAA
jgi:hypothetical protein